MAPETEDIRLASINIGVVSTQELGIAGRFWGLALGTDLKNWDGSGRSLQARIGADDHAFFFNLRIRTETEEHVTHRASFGISVPDLDAFRSRALAAGALEHYAPVESPEQPRHCLIEDPVGNRVVIWQR